MIDEEDPVDVLEPPPWSCEATPRELFMLHLFPVKESPCSPVTS